MKKFLSVTILMTVLLFTLVNADTMHSGTITSDETWYPSGNVHIITGNVTVNTGVTLTIMPGVIVKFYSNQSLIVSGSLITEATADSQIVFTSIKDDSYGGDTNGDNTATSPAPGDWRRIFINGADASGVFDHCVVKYGGRGTVPFYPMLQCDAGSLTVSNSVIGNSDWCGIYCYSGLLIISNNIFMNNGLYAAHILNVTGVLNISNINNTGNGNQVNGLVLSGCTITGNSSWTVNQNFPYVIDGVTIDTGATLTLVPGTLVKFLAGAWIKVNGSLEALGTPDSQIVFTSIKDDGYGGDTNGDSTATSPAPGDWDAISIEGTDATVVFDHCVV